MSNRKRRYKRRIKRLVAVILAAGFILTMLCIITANAETPQPTTAETAAVETPPTQTPETTTTILNLPAELESEIDAAAAKYSLDATLVRAVIYTESRGQIDAENAYCYGLMQLNKRYAETFTTGAGIENITDPANNIHGGCWFLAELMQWADGDETLALMAYNLGQSGAWKYWSSGTRSTSYTEKVQAAKSLFETQK